MKSKINKMTFLTLMVLTLTLLTAPVSYGQVTGPGLLKFGPITNGPLGMFPSWFMDKTGTAVEGCLTGPPFCLSSLADLGNPLIGEAFYWSATADLSVPGGPADLFELALEMAFLNPQITRANAMVFNRLRIRMTELPDPGPYTVTHPFGVTQVPAEPDPKNPLLFEINTTLDFPGTTSGASFVGVLRARNIGPFLRTVPAPVGRLGDGVTPRPVTGGLNGVNSVTVTNPATAFSRTTSLWAVEGKLATNGGLSNVAATYSRAANGTGTINMSASSIGGQRILATISSGATRRLAFLPADPARIGRYVRSVPFTAAQPFEPVTISNNTDAKKPFVTLAKVPDAVTITRATWAAGVLTVTASSSDLKVPRPLLRVTNPAGSLLLARRGQFNVAIPSPFKPATITVTSSAGGKVTAVVR